VLFILSILAAFFITLAILLFKKYRKAGQELEASRRRRVPTNVPELAGVDNARVGMETNVTVSRYRERLYVE
jgi:hypothetical protein